jgi:hypothetical protein
VTSVSEEHVAILRESEAREPRFRGVQTKKKEVRTKRRKLTKNEGVKTRGEKVDEEVRDVRKERRREQVR